MDFVNSLQNMKSYEALKISAYSACHLNFFLLSLPIAIAVYGPTDPKFIIIIRSVTSDQSPEYQKAQGTKPLSCLGKSPKGEICVTSNETSNVKSDCAW